ncbi:MAG: winged helix-turn-helix domain-containing protein [Candidatus Omnitrophica bacterium]|nr:winged helix-turn-helix domain-containing protein [Candidatus Omnitrophota bacterium]
MIEKLVTSKTRIKILKLFLSNIDDRYYLRELERLLDESLSPLRRQLVKLADMGILIAEEEANLKYYRLNKNFEGLEDLRKIVLGITEVETIEPEIAVSHSNDTVEILSASPKQVRYDLVFLSFISIFVLITAMFVVYANNKNIRQVASLISGAKPHAAVVKKAEIVNGEMISRKWKVMPGNVPVLSNGEIGEEKKSEEL